MGCIIPEEFNANDKIGGAGVIFYRERLKYFPRLHDSHLGMGGESHNIGRYF